MCSWFILGAVSCLALHAPRPEGQAGEACAAGPPVRQAGRRCPPTTMGKIQSGWLTSLEFSIAQAYTHAQASLAPCPVHSSGSYDFSRRWDCERRF